MKPVRQTSGTVSKRPTFKGMISSPHQTIALTFGLGLSPVAPGTMGSIGGFGLFIALQPLSLWARIAAYLLLIAIATWASFKTGEDLGEKDHNAIVIDETLGMSLVLEFIAPTAAGWIAAFALFRLFDVWKPWPVYLADQSPRGGFMVILDDLLAAGWAIIVLSIALLLDCCGL